MKIISFISEPLLICRILECTDLWQGNNPKGLSPPEFHDDIIEAVVCETLDDVWGRHDETDNTLH